MIIPGPLAAMNQLFPVLFVNAVAKKAVPGSNLSHSAFLKREGSLPQGDICSAYTIQKNRVKEQFIKMYLK